MPAHHETQTAFRAALAGSNPPPGITATGDLERRFSVYRNTVAHSLMSAVSQRFPVVCRIVGTEFFDAVAAVFVASHPPRTPLIHEYGAEFPEFLAAFPPAATLPYLPDVARIEVLRGLAYHAADAAPLAAPQIETTLGAAPEGAMLTLHPSLHVATSPHPAVSIWRMNQPGATCSQPAPLAEAALIFRAGDTVVVLSVAFDVAAIATALAQGLPLGRVMEDHPPDAIAQVLSVLLRHALVVDIRYSS